MSNLFSPLTIRGVELKNRIVMSPMCMYSSSLQDGRVTPWHKVHYASRAAGQTGLIMLEATAVLPEGRISKEDLGIWEDEQTAGLQELVDLIHEGGSKAAIQLAHAGRKSQAVPHGSAPSPIPFPDMPVPEALSEAGIARVIEAFKAAAVRARDAGFDVIELHGAHGYLLNQFLTPLANQRQDGYGGDREGRFLLMRQVIEEVRQVWDGPLFVRISADEYNEAGNRWEDFVYYARQMKELGVDLIDVSTGGVVPAHISPMTGYQVSYAEKLRQEAGIPTGAVGLITTGQQAEDILAHGQSDLIFIGRGLLRDPYWPRSASKELGVELTPPAQYQRAW